MILFRLAVLGLAAVPSAWSAPPLPVPAPAATSTAGNGADEFDLLTQRSDNKAGINATVTAAGVVLKPPPTAPGGATVTPQQLFAKEELERDRLFPPPGSYKKLVKFSDDCWPDQGCDKLASMGVVKGGYDFVDLKKRQESGLAPDEYQRQYDAIRGKVRGALDEFKPGNTFTQSAAEEFIKVTNPIATAILTKDELANYAARNAAISDSAPFYTNLGRVLNGIGPPSKAKEAFDQALRRDPRSEAALSGRAEAKLEMGDFPGAANDARAALAMDSKDMRALTALKFSEGRVAGAPLDGPPGAHGAAGGEGAGASASGADAAASPGAADGAAFARSGGVVSAELARRSDGLVVDAKHSLSMGDSAAAVESLRKAIELNPRNAQALSLSAMANIRLKNYPDALAAVEAGLRLAPNSAVLLDSKAFILNHMKDYQGALAAADLALSINPRDAVAYFNRAAALGGLRDRTGEIAALKAAAELDPARFGPVLEAALQLPEDADILYLFPGEAPAEAPAAAPPAAAAAPRPWVLPAGGALAILLLLALFRGLRGGRAAAARPPPLRATRASPSLLAGKYEVGREIGSGGMGVVYEGRDRSLSRAVAIKRMREEIRWDPKERERFVSEAKIVAKLRHPNIVEINAIVEEGGEIYLVFEHVKGRTLHEVLAAEKRLPFARARHLFRGVVSALDYAQGLGVVHRDLKPANIMLEGDGRARVMDFGIARLTEDALSRHSRTRAGAAVGTPMYMAPEQELSKAGKESDVYSLAVCLYESLTGTRPFGGIGAGLLMNKLKLAYVPPSQAAEGLPPGIDDVFAKGLEPEPAKRYASAGALLRALESLETSSPAA